MTVPCVVHVGGANSAEDVTCSFARVPCVGEHIMMEQERKLIDLVVTEVVWNVNRDHTSSPNLYVRKYRE